MYDRAKCHLLAAFFDLRSRTVVKELDCYIDKPRYFPAEDYNDYDNGWKGMNVSDVKIQDKKWVQISRNESDLLPICEESNIYVYTNVSARNRTGIKLKANMLLNKMNNYNINCIYYNFVHLYPFVR